MIVGYNALLLLVSTQDITFGLIWKDKAQIQSSPDLRSLDLRRPALT
jgi:hypothetical protein